MLPEPESSPEVHKSGHNLTDRIVGFSAIFISLCSLALAIHHGHIMDRLVESNSRPFIQFDTSDGAIRPNGEVVREISATVSNPGAGAARIEVFRITLDDHPVASWAEVLKLLKDKAAAKQLLPALPPPVGQLSYATVAPSYLRGGGELVILRWSRNDTNAALWDYPNAARASGRIKLTACCCSIFDQCWTASSAEFRPIEAKACA